MSTIDQKIKRLNDNLLLARKSLGWSAQEFGEKLGVSRQTINNLEMHRRNYNLTQMEYLAMRQVFQEEISNNQKGTTMLSAFLEYCVDNPDKYSNKEKEEIKKQIEALAPSMYVKTDRTARNIAICTAFVAVLATVGIKLILNNKK